MTGYDVPSSTSAVYHSDTVMSGPEGRSVEADVSRHLDPALDGQERSNGTATSFMSTHLNPIDDPGQSREVSSITMLTHQSCRSI